MSAKTQNKILFSLVFLMGFSGKLLSQKLDLSDLQNFTVKSPEAANTFLLTKGWEFTGSQKGDTDASTIIRWEFPTTDTTGAAAFMELTSVDKKPVSVRYQFVQKDFYVLLMGQISASGYKLIQDNIEDKKVTASYASAGFSLILNYKRENNDGKEFTSYEIILSPKPRTAATGLVPEKTDELKKEFDEKGVLVAQYYLKDGKREGPITYFLPDGKIRKEAMMKSGMENGLATLFSYDPKDQKLIGKTSGTILNDKQEGIWVKNKISDDSTIPVEMTTYENGLKQGEYRLIQNDSLVVKHYKNDLLEGNYRVFSNLLPNIKITEIDTAKLTRIRHGFYVENRKTGLWKNFDTKGNLTEEGYFLNDYKTGKWKYYYASSSSDANIPDEFSGKLYLEESYKDTRRNGEIIRYSFLKKEEIPCTDTTSKNCYRYHFERMTEKSTVVNDVLNGEYELTDADNAVVKKGVYTNGKASGKWTLRNDSPIIKRTEKTIETGLFEAGLKAGKWERTGKDNQILESCTYSDGILDGDFVLYQNNNPVERWHFSKGKPDELAFTDIDKNSITYTLSDVQTDNYICQKTEKNADGICLKTYIIKTALPTNENLATYRSDLEAMPQTTKILSGPYLLRTLGNKVLEEGSYEQHQKNGKWTTFYYDQNVKADVTYQNGNPTAEFYFDMKKNAPFSGEFLYKEKASGIVEERKIKDGLRHGTTRFKDLNDKTIKKESYKDGVLKE